MSHVTHTRAGHPEDQDDVTLYRRDGIHVTLRWLTVDNRRYRITDLQNLRTARGDRRQLRASTLSFAAGLMVVLVVASQYLAVALLPAVAVGMVAPAAVLAIAAASRPHACELWADYRGLTVQLFWLDDRERYNQICRAITRAKERAR
jgi:hypothetical protein